ncbi:putative mycofactocin radical SAM maturase MftC [bacterium MnTg02]|nr:putative mycofactocin radical SAM maturase MftC [bacterium MnTg02]
MNVQEKQAVDDVICAVAPEGLLAELTHRCPLQCPYCSNPLEMDRVNQELTTEQWIDVFKQAADMGILQIHLSGGEPTLRRDLVEIVSNASSFGLYLNLITSGVLLTREGTKALADAGLGHVQISIQDSDPGNANRIAAYKNGFEKKLQLAEWVREFDMSLTVNAPIHRQNIENVENIIDLAVKMGADRLEVAQVQYYGWAFVNRAALMPTYEQAVWAQKVAEKARERLKGIMAMDIVVPDYYAKTPKPCMGGWGRRFLNVTPSGKVLPCHAAETIKGLEFDNVKERKLLDIWMDSDAFNKFRGTDWMAEPCRSCELKEIDFGGCRCQAFAFTGDARNTDPACGKSSLHGQIVELAKSEAAEPPPPFVYRRLKGKQPASSP